MYERILVATDGSEAASRALEQALDLASTFDAELHAIAVVDTRRYGDSMLTDSADVVGDMSEYATELLNDVRSRADVDVTTELRRGHPPKAIGDYAESVDADLLVLGHRGRGSGDHIGSVAERVVRDVDRPVLTA
ncbi:universal stress protein [Natrarchaeobius sp. A-rgal3]|uniref:universal stress protein n=1 Tax=Natrarchaeobius versutus TaxID=1679078 RepID=UPI00350F505A